MNLRPSRWLNSVLLLSCLVAACGGGGGGGGSTTTLSGEVQFLPATTTIASEHAGATLDAQRTTVELRAGERVLVSGLGEEGVASLRLRSSERLRVAARSVSGGARLAALDAVSMDAKPLDSDGSFLVRGRGDLVVRATGAWTVELSATRAGSTQPWSGSLGAFLDGDSLELVAATGSTARFSCAHALELSIESDGALVARDGRGAPLGELGSSGGRLMLAASPLAAIELASTGAARARIVARAAEGRMPAEPLSAVAERARLGLDPARRTVGEGRHEYLTGRLLASGVAGASLEAEARSRGGRVARAIPDSFEVLEFDLPAGLDEAGRARATLALAAALEASGGVAWAEPDFRARAFGGTPPVDDPLYQYQAWHYELIRCPQAWAATTGSNQVRVAVIDTGRRLHPDLDPNTDTAGVEFDFISDPQIAADGGGRDGDAFDEGDGTGVSPSSFHGTHVAGTIGARGGDAFGVCGVGFQTRMFHLRVLGVGGGLNSDIIDSVRYAAGLAVSGVPTLSAAQKADVVNMSLGGGGFSQAFQTAVTAARNAGCVIIAAAGNENTSQTSFPAGYAGVISVAAVDRNAVKAPYSNFGSTIDIAAPGGDESVDLDGDGVPDGVVSTLNTEAGLPTFAAYQGTSMAAPHVAGVAALVLAVDPTLTVAEVEAILLGTVVDLGAPGRDNIFGHGLLQADAAVAAAAGAKTKDPVLVLGGNSLAFGAQSTTLDLAIQNGGGGGLVVQAPNVFGGTGEASVTAQLLPAGAGTNASGVRVSVERDSLVPGSYSTTLQIDSNGGSGSIAVSFVVEAPTTKKDIPLYLLLVDAEELFASEGGSVFAVAFAELNPSLELAWRVDEAIEGGELPAGDYIVVCGSDDSDDDADPATIDIFGAGDTYGGGWPSLNELAILPVSAGDVLSGIDFAVRPFESVPASARAMPRIVARRGTAR
jgi:serine protease